MDNNSSKNGINGKYHLSIVLSFVVAIFAIVSLIAFGFNQISFAAPTDGVGAESFKLAFYKIYTETEGEDQGHGQSDRPVAISSYTNGGSYQVPILHVNDGTATSDYNSIVNVEPVFCFGKASDAAGDGLDYTSNGGIQDRKIAYILDKSGIYSTTSSIIPRNLFDDTDEGRAKFKYMEIYATQVALWMINDPDIASHMSVIESATSYSLSVDQQMPVASVYEDPNKVIFSYINNTVEEAKSVAETYKHGKEIKVTLGETTSDVEGTNYIQSSLVQITASPVDDLISYDVRIEGVEGIIAVDENGKELPSLTGLTPSDKFYLRIPKDKITSGTNEVTVYVTGHFRNANVPYLYRVNDHQDVVRRQLGDVDLYGQGSLTLMSSPDTSASTSQTIYFIGLVVLLCGVGIIYANSKAIKNA